MAERYQQLGELSSGDLFGYSSSFRLLFHEIETFCTKQFERRRAFAV